MIVNNNMRESRGTLRGVHEDIGGDEEDETKVGEGNSGFGWSDAVV